MTSRDSTQKAVISFVITVSNSLFITPFESGSFLRLVVSVGVIVPTSIVKFDLDMSWTTVVSATTGVT